MWALPSLGTQWPEGGGQNPVGEALWAPAAGPRGATVSVRVGPGISLDGACVAPCGRAWDQSGQPDQWGGQDVGDPWPHGREPREAQEKGMPQAGPQG